MTIWSWAVFFCCYCRSVDRMFAQYAWGSGFDPQYCIGQAWWYKSVIPALGRWGEVPSKGLLGEKPNLNC